ncbi:MAG: methylmalonyl Co-A mutase-associated GTPase MeaB [Acidimicrobiales bacterium]|jgi:LAO/AO transport system kinase|nr:methylmalonyl Co-A mutase-associated GTPase MeaB [Acidimicrobiales bacterium]MDG1845217.1 methylmalonyl Co-A mutase-associated GTPase MeaB [Acidimicrobiales bacterium]
MQASELDLITAGVLSGDRTWIGRAITLVESRSDKDTEQAAALLQTLLPYSGASQRVGITGAPGVGKSTFIDELGTRLTDSGRRVAVLAVDPSSSISGGSILGDKTRMDRLSSNLHAFIRPSPASGLLGGVARNTRETMVVLEAAGFDVVLVETVGVGQSESQVAEMVDFFLVLLLPGAGDTLQGIKKGVLEIADLLAVNKADGENELRARQAARDYQSATELLTSTNPNWDPPVMTCSGMTGQGLDAIWQKISDHRDLMVATGDWESHRAGQKVRWMWSLIEDRLIHSLRENPEIAEKINLTEQAVRVGSMAPPAAAETILHAFRGM